MRTMLWLVFCACSAGPSENQPSTTQKLSTEGKTATQKIPRMIILGDSLTAGMGLAIDSAYPKLLEQRLKEEQLPTEILNAGQSGDTTAGGLRRIDWLLNQKPELLVIELGANDGLRGVALEEIRSNLDAMIKKAKEAQIPVMLMDMRIPPNYGEEYTRGFQQIYSDLAKEHNIELLPFLLDTVAGDKQLNQGDGIHPTKEGHVKIAERLYDSVRTWRKGLDDG